MKKFLVLLFVAAIAAPIFAQNNLPEYKFASGDWQLTADRLYQNNPKAAIAKVNIRMPQAGSMTYEFDARYEGGAEDGHGGFGIHVFADSVHPGFAWGNGKSYLIWINFDMNPTDPAIPKGFSAQVYQSLSHREMKLIESIDLNAFAPLMTADTLGLPIPLKIRVDSEAGEIRLYDPTMPDTAYTIAIKGFPKSGEWISLRTNGMKVSFGLPQ